MSTPPAGAPALELRDISAGYAGRLVLREVSVEVGAGESAALIGPNGCGKSTLFRVAAGLVRPESGETRSNGVSLNGLSCDERVRSGVSYLPQTRNVFTGLSVNDNLRLASGPDRDSAAYEQRARRITNLFSQLAESGRIRAGLLSGGQRQTLAVAMALMRPTALLLLDEPVAGLSPGAGRDLLDAVQSFQEAEDFAVVIIEHRLKQVQPHVRRVLVMREGRIVDDTRDTAKILDAQWLSGHYANGKRLA